MLLTKKVEVLTEPNNRNPIAESKGVHCEVESEGSRRQKFDKTNRNLIQGLFSRVIELRIKMPDSYTEGKGGKSGLSDGKGNSLPREVFTGSLRRDNQSGNRATKP